MSKVLPSVKLMFNRNAAELVAAGYKSVEEFAGLTVSEFQEILASIGIVSSAKAVTTPPSSAGEGDIQTTADGEGQQEVVQFMGIDVDKRTYGTGRDRRVYQNAKAFEGSAYMNISLPMGDKHHKLAGINLQDFSENGAGDTGTRRGRAMLLRLLKEHGLEKCGTIKFEVELNVSALTEHNEEALTSDIENFFSK